MSRSLTAFSNVKRYELYEGLEEIFDSEPFKTSFTFKDTSTWIETERFIDPNGNMVRVYFHKLGRNFFELDFTFNGETYKDSGTSYSFKEYSVLLTTIAAVVTQFLEEYKPDAVEFLGADSYSKIEKDPKMKGQKDRIYDGFLSRVKDPGRMYYTGKNTSTGQLTLVRRSGEPYK